MPLVRVHVQPRWLAGWRPMCRGTQSSGTTEGQWSAARRVQCSEAQPSGVHSELRLRSRLRLRHRCASRLMRSVGQQRSRRRWTGRLSSSPLAVALTINWNRNAAPLPPPANSRQPRPRSAAQLCTSQLRARTAPRHPHPHPSQSQPQRIATGRSQVLRGAAVNLPHCSAARSRWTACCWCTRRRATFC